MTEDDALGLFWREPKKTKKAEKSIVIPSRVWERPDYLPGLNDAARSRLAFATWDDLYQAAMTRTPLIFDIECYPNFFMIAFSIYGSDKYVSVHIEQGQSFDANALTLLQFIHQRCLLVGFNSRNYDVPMFSFAVAGYSTERLNVISNEIIQQGKRGYEICKENDVVHLAPDHIDIIEVCPVAKEKDGGAFAYRSLKSYAGRSHAKWLQDLPYAPHTRLNNDQKSVVYWYCLNDLANTSLIYSRVLPQLELRQKLSAEHGIDLRSKSDAQIAEAVLTTMVKRSTGVKYLKKPNIEIGKEYRYRVPPELTYATDNPRWACGLIADLDFVVGPNGRIITPERLSEMAVPIGEGVYRMGIGGLHSSESKQCVRPNDEYGLCEFDVASYYPMIILNQQLAPPNLGQPFLRAYESIVTRRLEAKAAKDKVTADSLKITINGTFGKTASIYSMMYSPDLMFQVTLSGQLYLLMLIDYLEVNGFEVVSANTDGIVVRYLRARENDMLAITNWWEKRTRFTLERGELAALYSRDVNNYLALKTDNEVKVKGVFSRAGLGKNPIGEVCISAITNLIRDNRPVVDTIRSETEISEFLLVRNVRGGGVKIVDGRTEYLGKVARWYYSTSDDEPIVYAKNGNIVPKTHGAKPLMVLPDSIPVDVDHERYIRNTNDMLDSIAFPRTE